ncbi:MAG: DUF4266 domain-containing protein [Flavobacteriales bacterium]|nr:DUF4266 domain-containing protein [Flavobacteriales bacterium]
MKTLKTITYLFLLLVLASCKTVAPYESMYINDEEMQMEGRADQNFETYIYSIREGGTSSGAPKSSGGCGCN